MPGDAPAGSWRLLAGVVSPQQARGFIPIAGVSSVDSLETILPGFMY